MSKCKVSWSDINGASPKTNGFTKKRKKTTFCICPTQECEHDKFQSQRGCRKHINTKPSWFFYFDEKPNVKERMDSLKEARNFAMQNSIKDQTCETTKHAVKLLPSFLVSCDNGEASTKWLSGSG